ncbi:maturation protein [ssRNA phage SRR7976310_9]|uniref:Maturation protein n=1 Tax=ssRNA phage SRR7976310_9 TaxID=2786687 RepID=A0A8S5L5L4_9VIRU|nr:maturation protein [ssRNA phage SRR7976310_9]DAD52727.1 TPA_asm: maturation protein [ssRNA phage SRR7976310_9]
MRTRTDSDPPHTGSLHVYVYCTNPPSTVDYGTVTWLQRGHHGKICDEPSWGSRWRANGHGIRPMKTCYHDQYDTSSYGSPMRVQTDSVHSVDQSTPEIWRAFSWSADTVSTDVVYAQAVDAGPIDSGHYDRWQAVKPTLETRASLAVFLYELREISSLWNLLPRKHLSRKGRSITNWRDVLNYANDLHLNYNFGWKPFLSDVASTFRGVDSFERRYMRYLKYIDKELVRRFRDTPTVESLNREYTYGPNPFYTVVWKGTRTSQYASAFDFTYNSPYATGDGSAWRRWADTLGLNLNPSTIWAVLPWSFVVDWFVDVGGMLKSTEDDWMQTAITIHQGCYSRRLYGELSLAMRAAYGGVTLPEIKISFAQYIRCLGLPHFSSSSSLDADKIRLGASLLYGRL